VCGRMFIIIINEENDMRIEKMDTSELNKMLALTARAPNKTLATFAIMEELEIRRNMGYTIDLATVPEGVEISEVVRLINAGEMTRITKLGINWSRTSDKATVNEYSAIKCACHGVKAKDCKC